MRWCQKSKDHIIVPAEGHWIEIQEGAFYRTAQYLIVPFLHCTVGWSGIADLVWVQLSEKQGYICCCPGPAWLVIKWVRRMLKSGNCSCFWANGCPLKPPIISNLGWCKKIKNVPSSCGLPFFLTTDGEAQNHNLEHGYPSANAQNTLIL
jgi:hypothetical protein